MEIQKNIEREIVEDNAYLVSERIKGFIVVNKVNIGAVKSIDFQNVINEEITTVVLENGIVKYDGLKIDLPNMLGKVEKILRVRL